MGRQRSTEKVSSRLSGFIPGCRCVLCGVLLLFCQLAVAAEQAPAGQSTTGQSTPEDATPEQSSPEQALLPQAVRVAPEDVTVVGVDQYDDPLEPMNRVIFSFNDVVYRYALIPLGNAYGALPQDVRDGVSRVFLNLREPLSMVNHTAQGDFAGAGKNIFRFLTNTVVGIGGIFDPADNWFGVSPQASRFNDTFQVYGMANGPYLVLPFMGSTDVRGGIGSVLDSALHPVRIVTEEPQTTYVLVFDNFQQFAPSADVYLDLRAQSDDPYVYFRNQYLQGVDRDRQFPLAGDADSADDSDDENADE